MGRIDRMCDWAVAIANDDSHGYTQGDGRMGPTDYDCAGLAIRAAQHAGYDTGYASYTGDMVPALTAKGWRRLAYSAGALKRGDMEIRPKTATRGGHVAIALGGGRIVEAYANEFGGAIGGRPGDQTGNEIRVAWDYGFGTYILRPPADPAPAPAPKPKPTEVPKKGPDEELSMPQRQGAVRRLFNPNNGDHLYTTNPSEVTSLVKAGWHDEGTIGTAPADLVDVYRLWNVSTGEHMLTDSYDEARSCLKAGRNLSDGTRSGWQYEGVAFVARNDDKGPVRVHRLYNPHAKGPAHMLTSSDEEVASLTSVGWTDEGVVYSLDA